MRTLRAAVFIGSVVCRLLADVPIPLFAQPAVIRIRPLAQAPLPWIFGCSPAPDEGASLIEIVDRTAVACLAEVISKHSQAGAGRARFAANGRILWLPPGHRGPPSYNVVRVAKSSGGMIKPLDDIAGYFNSFGGARVRLEVGDLFLLVGDGGRSAAINWWAAIPITEDAYDYAMGARPDLVAKVEQSRLELQP
jgi:hypothetical protein